MLLNPGPDGPSEVIMAAFEGQVAVDLVNVFSAPKGGNVVTTLAWGDTVRVLGRSNGTLKVQLGLLTTGGDKTSVDDRVGFIRPPSKSGGFTLNDVVTKQKQDPGVLKMDFVDVQQGDAALIETAKGRVVLVDGGDNQLFARYLASRFPGTSDNRRKSIDCIVITHGDADHFAGLTEIHRSESYAGINPGEERRKRLFIQPKRIYHNGLAKRPGKKKNKSTRPDKEMFGRTATSGGKLFVTGLENDISTMSPDELNLPFQGWRTAVRAWKKNGTIEVKRLARRLDGIPPPDAFDFLSAEGIEVEIFGPLEHRIGGKPALPFLGQPVAKAERQPGTSQVLFKGLSASHTINGHSIVLRLKYGNCRILFAGDLNEESEAFLTDAHEKGELDLTAEIFKVPHHGSADFSVPFLRAVSPAVSVISSGDESEQKEHIHPRATLVGGLSKQGRPTLDEPLILVTELAAFFKVEGWVVNDRKQVQHRTQQNTRKGEWFAFSRKAFGIVKVRTNGQRLLVFTYSGKDDMKEAYAFKLQGERVIPEPVRKG
jgi:beta-lactamase superfamily II metal-dependent hydrolase